MKKIITVLFIIALSAACKESYEPPVITTNLNYLVVEGFINDGPDSTIITLSHTYRLVDTAQATPELNARVTVEAKDGEVYPLGEIGNGNYGVVLGLNPTVLYQLHIITAGGKEYRSDYVPVKISPPIDSVNWVNTPNGLQIYANTHDPQRASTYYRWSYSETWEFHAVYYSELQYIQAQDTVVPRINDSFYTCWKGDLSTTILLGSSASLAQDLIYEQPIVLVPEDSWEISDKYSVDVKQYVLTPEAYTFWLNLQKNTEQLGSIFSPQPSEVKGNIHNVADSTETVVGYISIGTLAEKRLYITPDQIPHWNITSYTNNCHLKSILGLKDSLTFYLSTYASTNYIPVDYDAASPPFPPYIFDIADDFCVDCTRVGSNVKPAFWQ